tara:strand:- start:53 stop:469 length:417 start_codon:yes stop_codon:yes gene_type:complete
MYHIRRRMERYGVRGDEWQHFAIRPMVNGKTSQWCRRLIRDTSRRSRAIEEVNRSMLTTGWQIVRSKASYTTQSGQKSHNQWLHVSLAFDASLVREDTQEEIERRQADAERRAKLARLAEVEEEIARLRAFLDSRDAV